VEGKIHQRFRVICMVASSNHHHPQSSVDMEDKI
jgi:hypothetical protein